MASQEPAEPGLVGFLAAEVVDQGLHIAEMGVVPSSGRQGIGRALLKAAVEHAGQRGLRGVTLTTFAHIPWNAPFYAKNGFVELAPAHVGPGLAERIERERELGLVDRVAMWHSGDGALSRAHLQ